MKKVFYSFVAAAMFAGVISCGNTEETVVTEDVAVEEAVEIPAEDVIVTEDAVIVEEGTEVPVEAPAAQ
jgi:ribosomal protein L21